jgi:predicted acyl esterase
LQTARVLAGPIDATIYATSTAPETFLEATVEDIGPDGSSTPLTSGGLLGSFRAVDRGLSWYAAGGNPVLPYHPYTQASASTVPTGKITRFDIEVFPTFARIAAGHSIRLTITTSDFPHVDFTPAQLASLSGGVYAVQRNAAAPSFLELPLASPSAFGSCGVCH